MNFTKLIRYLIKTLNLYSDERQLSKSSVVIKVAKYYYREKKDF